MMPILNLFDAALPHIGICIMDRALDSSNARFVSWRCIPPASPFMGGAWEIMVRADK